VRSLPFPRRLQLVKLLRAHGVKDVERLREDELREALTALGISLPDLVDDAPFAPPSSTTSGAIPQELTTAAIEQAIDVDADDPHALPQFREPRVSLPEHDHTFVRAIAVAPGELYCTWQLHTDVVPGPVRLRVHTAEYLGTAPPVEEMLQRPGVDAEVDRDAPGWYLRQPPERLAFLVELVVKSDAGDVVVATSNPTLAPPSRPAPAGPLWMATLTSDVDRRALRNSGLLQPSLPAGAHVEHLGTVDDSGITTVAGERVPLGIAASALQRVSSASGASASGSSLLSTLPSSSSFPSSSLQTSSLPSSRGRA
jgi:hypothetical protein